MMALTRLIVCAVLGCCLATAASLAMHSYVPLRLSSQELSSYEQQVAEGLAKHLVELEDALKIKLPDNKSPTENMQVVRELLDGVSALKVSKKMALKMVVKLEDATKDCSHKSYKVLAKNHIANIEAERLYRKTGNTEALRSKLMLDFYQKLHSERCFEVEREMFHLALPLVDETNLLRVQGALKEIGRYDYKYGQDGGVGAPAYWLEDSQRKRFLTMRLDELTVDPIPDATKKIVKNLIAMVRASDEWESLKPRVEASSAGPVYPRPPKKILDDFLFKPCADYEKVLGEKLNHARLDAMVEEEGLEFLAKDQRFYKAMIQSRICKQVLEEQSKLYKVLADRWVLNVSDSYFQH